MKQSRIGSLIESVGGTAVGFAVAMIAQAIFWPLLGFDITVTQNLIATSIMTVLSVARGYLWRRVCEALRVVHPLTPAMLAVVAERRRQIEVEGWTREHDDQHAEGELAAAGAAYALHAARRAGCGLNRRPPSFWPWEPRWWKPDGFRRELVKAAALILAELEKFDRGQRKVLPARFAKRGKS